MYWQRYLVNCMAGATWKLHGWCHMNYCRLGANSVYTIQPCSFIQSHILGACVFRCNLPPALLTEWSGSFTCYCGNTGVERIPIIYWSQHRRLTLKKKSPTAPAGTRTQGPFDHESDALTTELSPLWIKPLTLTLLVKKFFGETYIITFNKK